MMSWDRSTRPKRLRRKQRRFLLWFSVFVALILVASLSAFNHTEWNGSLKMMMNMANSILSDEEKKTVWQGMSDEGKDVLRRHVPIPKLPNE